MHLESVDRATVPGAVIGTATTRAKPFSSWATAAYAALAITAVLYIMRGYWAGDRLATLYYPLHTALHVMTVNMLVHDGTTHVPSGLRGLAGVFGSDADELARESQEILHDVIPFLSSKDASSASQLRGQLVVLLGETGAESEALNLLRDLDDAKAADFRLAAGAVYGGSNSLSSIPSLLGKRPFEYLESSWAAWRFQNRWHDFAEETSDARWVKDWIDHRARNKTLVVGLVSAVCLIAIAIGAGLLFWMIQPEARRVFQNTPLEGVPLGEGLGIYVRAHLLGTLLLLLCYLHPFTRIPTMCYGIAMLTPLLFLLARRHWRYGSWANLFGLPATRRACLVLVGAAVCVFALDWVSLAGIGAAAREFGIKSHWTEGLDEALLYEHWPVRLVPVANGIVWSPIYEEVAFRGLLFPALRTRFGVLLAAALSSIVFASLHFYSLAGCLGVAMFGFINALTCHYTRSLLPSIGAHMGTNFIILGTQTALFA
jgi:membrane protease YdiL (CAAX protease family)